MFREDYVPDSHNGWQTGVIGLRGSLVWLHISVLSVDFKTPNGIRLTAANVCLSCK